MAFLNANFDNSFNDSAKIWLEGAGEGFTPADPSLIVRFTDTFNNRTYLATQPGEPELVGVGASMLTQAQVYMDDYDYYAGEADTSAADLDYYKWRVTNIVENIEVVRGLYDYYGYLIF